MAHSLETPDWSKDEASLEGAKEYLRIGDTVDFFEYVLSSLMRQKPEQIPSFCLDLVLGLRKDGSVYPLNTSQYTREKEGAYLEENGICDFLNQWIVELLNTRPETNEDRMEFHENYLKNILVQKNISKVVE